jgi:Fe2+ transport system protein FeoA
MNADSAIKQRMLDMGITPNTELRVERYAPLRDPIQIRLKGYSLALRVSEGKLIEVERITGK